MKPTQITILFLILYCSLGVAAEDPGKVWRKVLEEMSAAKELKVVATTGNPEVPKLSGPILLKGHEQKLPLMEILSGVTLRDTGRTWEPGVKLFTNQVFTCEYKTADGTAVVITVVGDTFKFQDDKRMLTCDFFPFRAVVSELLKVGQAGGNGLSSKPK